MARAKCWLAVVGPASYAEQRLYADDSIPVNGAGPAIHDLVALAATEPSVLFGLGRVSATSEGNVTVAYTHRLFDRPSPMVQRSPGWYALSAEHYRRLTGDLAPATGDERSRWLVSLVLPVEAPTAGEAVRQFWSYVAKLGPGELPAFVWPPGDELAMQAYVLGEQTDLDPEQGD